MGESKAMSLQTNTVPRRTRWQSLNPTTRRTLEGYLFASPWIIGFFIFTLGPFVASFWISLNRWDILTPMHFNGLDNYIALFQDELFWKSLSVTIIYFVLSVPAQ